MRIRFVFFLLVCQILTHPVQGQTSFKDSLRKADPVPPEPALASEEKIKIHREFLEAGIRNKDPEKTIFGYIYLFLDHLKTHDYPAATRYLLEAENVAKASGKPGWQGMVSHLNGVLSLHFEKYGEAIQAYEKAAALCGEGRDSFCLGESLEQLSAMYGQTGDMAKAHRYFEMAMPLLKKFGDEARLNVALHNFALLLVQQNRPAEAIPYFNRSLAFYEKNKNPKEEAQCLNNLAAAYISLKNYDLAIQTYQRCIRINQEFNIQENLLFNYLGLYNIYEQKKDYKTANEFLVNYYHLRDTVIGAETQKKIADLQIQYQSKEKELDLKKTEVELGNAQRSLEHRTIFIGFVLVIALAGLWRWRVQSLAAKRRIMQSREELTKLTHLLLEKNTRLKALEEELAEQPSWDDQNPDIAEFEKDLYNQRILTETDWAEFKNYFEKAYPGYLLRLRNACPALTGAEERLFLFIKLKLNSNEAASMLGISAESVKKTRYRLRKRLELEEETDLNAYIYTFR